MVTGRTFLNTASVTIVSAGVSREPLADESKATGTYPRGFRQMGGNIVRPTRATNEVSEEVSLMQGIHKDVRIREAVRLLNENSSCTLCEVARRCHLSLSRLSHLFKAETGLTVEDYRRHCRFRAATKMLETTDLSVKQIAYALGYHHTSSFVRAFTLQSGASPNRYRKRQLDNRSSDDLAIRQA